MEKPIKEESRCPMVCETAFTLQYMTIFGRRSCCFPYHNNKHWTLLVTSTSWFDLKWTLVIIMSNVDSTKIDYNHYIIAFLHSKCPKVSTFMFHMHSPCIIDKCDDLVKGNMFLNEVIQDKCISFTPTYDDVIFLFLSLR